MISKELVAASTKPLILSVLAGGEDYGYSIIQRVAELSNGKLHWSEGMLYPVLHRLEKERLILSRWKKGDSGRRRKYYRLSAAGKKARTTSQADWLSIHDTLLKLWELQPCTN